MPLKTPSPGESYSLPARTDIDRRVPIPGPPPELLLLGTRSEIVQLEAAVSKARRGQVDRLCAPATCHGYGRAVTRVFT